MNEVKLTIIKLVLKYENITNYLCNPELEKKILDSICYDFSYPHQYTFYE